MFASGSAPTTRPVPSLTGPTAAFADGRRAATQWALCDLLEQRFPAVTVVRVAIFVRQEHIWTSAGVTAGIDLTLALVEEDFGRAVAMDLARELAVFMKRPAAQFLGRCAPIGAFASTKCVPEDG